MSETEVYLPRRVVEYLLKPSYLKDGCNLTVVDEVFDGTPITRWIIDNTIVWTAPQEEGRMSLDEKTIAQIVKENLEDIQKVHNLQTGTEWLDRFEKELAKQDYHPKRYMLAAQRASGLKES